MSLTNVKPIEFKIKEGNSDKQIYNNSVEENLELVYQNLPLIIRKHKNTTSAKALAEAIMATQNRSDYARNTAYELLFQIVPLINNDAETFEDSEIEKYEKLLSDEIEAIKLRGGISSSNKTYYQSVIKYLKKQKEERGN